MIKHAYLMHSKPWQRGILLCSLFIYMAVACVPKETAVPLDEAYSEIGTAIAIRAERCNGQPGYPLLLPGKPNEYGLRLCSLLILQGECPFQDFPIACLEIYTEVCDNCDIPLFNP